MKTTLLFTALFLLLVISAGYADPLPVPEEDTKESSIEVEVEPTPTKYYSPWVAGFGNLFPGLGYFLIDELWWAAAEYALMGGGFLWGALVAADPNLGYMRYIIGTSSFLTVYSISLIHAPLLADYKNEQQVLSLDLSPGVGLDSSGEVYPTVQLTLSF
ncbi:hypothetical protein K8R78_00860 [bacterium]|nr:hypothetical protein [bacterium]